ncbi:MAG: DUF99 family protein [Candidatus Methanomethylicia archaeon]|nr:DUF99 family protein [Candidatus Methanomethylicia archaeon]
MPETSASGGWQCGGRWRAPVVLAVGGGRFSKSSQRFCPIAFLLCRGTAPIALIIKDVEVDGLDATERALEAIAEARRLGWPPDALLAPSLPLAGFNVIDPQRIASEGGVPFIAVLRERPDDAAVRGALIRHFADADARIRILDRAGRLHSFSAEGGEAFISCCGIEADEALNLVGALTVFGKLPEPLRIALAIGRAVGDALSGSPAN